MLLFALALAPAARADAPALTGRWVVAVDRLGVTDYYNVRLVQNGDQLSGDFDGDPVTGTVRDGAIAFLGKDSQGGFEDVRATLVNGALTGTVTMAFSGAADHPSQYKITAARVVEHHGPPRKHDFVPSVFHRTFAATTPPVLTIAPGDTIVTSTVDAGGFDAKGTPRVAGGNPQTGPFFVDGALPGDTLVVHIDKLKLNRGSAISSDGIASRAKDGKLAIDMKDTGKQVRWKLDLARGVATSEAPGAHLGAYAVPVRPMLGCVGVAPSPAAAAPGTGDSGSWGGNLDYNDIVEGATVYLPIYNPGALLYVGDGHAAQGDGELTGDALETSMDVQITVHVIPGKRPPSPRVESASHLAAIGLAGSLDDAFKAATANMAAWLGERYQLTPSEIAQVLGTAAEYRVSEVPDRNAGIVLRLAKDRLRGLAAR
ncbi:MAG TPA: acetamidase/formamidase family protein [Kofleriaceae bacterium]|nr:acetamidase/formamidase family protein [Kofleriaceae bacterium]